MKKKDNTNAIERRSLVKVMGTAALAGLAVNASTANAQNSANTNGFTPMRHSEDSWLDELSGNHRVFVDTSSALGGVDGLLYSANIMNTHNNVYAGSDEDYAMILCFRHNSTPFAFNDAIWEKYGDIFYGIMQYADPKTGEAPKMNLLNSADHAMFPGLTIDGMAARDVQFAICSNATRFFSGAVAGSTDASAADVFDELVANAVPNSRFVSAGVIAATRAQEYGYSLLSTG
ncbi:hypothetical protein JYT97_02805 [Haliea sp. AH-315-K21]|nr:hypothetical protein [Haliea sp. AH-315-K21]